MLHAAILLAVVLVAAPLASYIPLAALGAMLVVVASNMAERHEFAAILTRSRGEAAVLLATFLLTVFRDLIEGIAVGVVLGSLVFMHRVAHSSPSKAGASLVEDDVADRNENGAAERDDRNVAVYTIAGRLFFGASAAVAAVLERVGPFPGAVILDVSRVPLADATAAASLRSFARRAHHHGAAFYIAGASRPVLRVLLREGLRRPVVRFSRSVADARQAADRALAERELTGTG
jgi:sulfate permease, SulP family